MVIELKSTGERPQPIEMYELTDPEELEKARVQREQFDRNSAWLQGHFAEIYTPANFGKILCIAGEEAFLGDEVREVIARATAAHPEDKGLFTRMIPREKRIMIYAAGW